MLILLKYDTETSWHHARTSSLSSICVTVEVLTMGSSIPSIKTQFPAGILLTSMLYLKRNNLNT